MEQPSNRIAYLREFSTTGQCELMFVLKIKLETVSVIKEEVRAVQQASDTVGSLLQHIINEIKKIIQTLNADASPGEGANSDIKIEPHLQRRMLGTPIKSNMVLKNLIQLNMQDLELSILKQSYWVTINAPFVKELKLPFVLYSNFIVQPSKCHVLFADNNECRFTWYKSQDKINWIQVGTEFRYVVADEDIAHFLKLVCVPCNKLLTGPTAEAVSENQVEKMGDLPVCPFEQRHKFTTHNLKKNNFRVVSYNILSNRYTDINEQFSYCSPRALAQDYRKQLIAKELIGYQADIMCLQEVDSFLFINYYKDIFKEKGYVGYYHRKGNRSSEGLACFFNNFRFQKINEHQIIYSNELKRNKLFSYLRNMVNKNPSLKECFIKQMTSLHITILKMREKNHYILVANTHLFYRSDAELVRILQINIATTYLTHVCRKFFKNGGRVNVIFCGDFNSTPSSAVFDYMVNGAISKSHEIFRDTKHAIDLSHDFHFESACGKPKYTNYTLTFKDCLDYVFIEKNKIKVNNIVPLPSEEELGGYEGLPNNFYPSDHLALVVDLKCT